MLRSVGDDFEPKQFCTWAPKAIAMIGRMPPTLYSRSVRVELKRKTATEYAEPLRPDCLAALKPLRRQAARWAKDNIDALRPANPEIPETLYSRVADNWLPLFAIADRAGGEWPGQARLIAESFVTKSNDETTGILLLTDIADIFDRRNVDQLHSDDVVADLVAEEGRPWAEYSHGKELTKNQLAKLLKPFEIEPKQVKIDGKNRNGYLRWFFAEAFERYLPDRGCGSSTASTAMENKEFLEFQNSTAENPVEFSKCPEPLWDQGGRVCRTSKPPR